MPQSPLNSKPERDAFIGRRLGKYRLVGKLGEGGMGTVYEAEDESLKRRVALKLVTGNQPHEAQRFVVEAQAAARLNHPNVVIVYEVDEVDGQQFLVMELVKGMSASDYLRTRGPLKWTLATRVLIAACRGLAAAHKAGLIHRDLKPGNILLAKSGDIKLADFGLAKCVDGSQRSFTAQGTLLGTPEYMSPEQCSSDRVTPQSDLYSLGACYFALLTGKPPFVCDLPVQTMFAHCSQPVPDPRDRVADIPPACVEVIRCAMAKQPHERFANAAAMQTALEALLKQDHEREPTLAIGMNSKAASDERDPEAKTLTMAKHTRSHWLNWLLGAGMALAAFALVVALMSSGSKNEEGTTSTSEPQASGTRGAMSSEPPAVQEPMQGKEGLLGKATRAGHVLNVTDGTERAFISAVISPNGRYLAVRTLGRHAGRLLVWDLQQLEPMMDRQDVEYSRRGQWLQIGELTGARLLAFTHRSDWLIVGSLSDPDAKFDVEAWPIPAKPGQLRKTLNCGRTVRSLSTSPNRDELAVSLTVPNATNDDSFLIFSDWPRSAARPMTRQRTHRTSANHLLFDPAGEAVWISNGSNNVIQFPIERPGQRSRIETSLTVSAMALGKVGEQTLVALGGSNIVEVWNTRTRQLVGGLKLSEQQSLQVTALEFAADGRSLFVACNSNDSGEVLAVNTATWARRARLGTSLPLVSSLTVSPTGSLLVGAGIDGTLRLWKLEGN